MESLEANYSAMDRGRHIVQLSRKRDESLMKPFKIKTNGNERVRKAILAEFERLGLTKNNLYNFNPTGMFFCAYGEWAVCHSQELFDKSEVTEITLTDLMQMEPELGPPEVSDEDHPKNVTHTSTAIYPRLQGFLFITATCADGSVWVWQGDSSPNGRWMQILEASNE